MSKIKSFIFVLLQTAVLLTVSAAAQAVVTFTDVTASAGLTTSSVQAGSAWADYDEDGCIDLAVSSNDLITLNKNNCDGTFTDVSVAAGFTASLPVAKGIAWGDFDGDNDLDLYGAVQNGNNVLYQNNGDGTFTDVAAAAGVDDPRGTSSVAWGDYNNDGHLDMFLASRFNADSVDRLYKNNGDGTFTDVGPDLGVSGNGARLTWSGAWVDFDNNGTLDLYVAVDFGDDVVYSNNGDGTFTDVTATATGGEPQHGMGLAVGDIQGDGCLDILVTNNTQGFPGDIEHRRSVVWRNNCDGTFTIVSLPAGIEDRATVEWGVNFVDYDNDGDQDVSIVSGGILSDGEPNVLYENNNGTLTNVTDATGTQDMGAAWGSTWADYDADGDLDWFVTNQIGSNVLYRNDGPVGNYLKVLLRGTTSNTYGVGARVELSAGGETQVRFIQAGVSFQSAEELAAFFGLDTNAVADEIKVFWPSGIIDVLTAQSANQTIVVNEGTVVETVGTISGNITDSSAVPVESARVRTTNVDTAVAIRVTTDVDGNYTIPELIPGNYSVRAQKPGLENQTQVVEVTAGANTVVDFVLVGDVTPPSTTLQFTEVSVAAGLSGESYFGETGHSLGVNWIDYDNDGLVDLFLPNGFGFTAHLYHNNGDGTFTLSDELLPVLPNVEMSGSRFGDYDNDGDSDIFIAVDNEDFQLHDPNFQDGPANMLLKNMWVENGNQIVAGQPLFVESAAAAGVQDLVIPADTGVYPARRTKTMGLLDFDRDGCIDLFWGQMVLQSAGEPANENRLYHNNCDGTFTDASDSAGVSPAPDPALYYRPTLAFTGAHLDGNRWPDMYVCNVHETSPYHHDVIYLNNGDGTFTDSTGLSLGVGNDSGSCMGVDVADIDLNGTWDLYASDVRPTLNDESPQGNPLYLGNGDGTFQDNSAVEAGVSGVFSWAVNFFDADLDGYEDLFVSGKSSEESLMFRNNQDGTFEDQSVASGISILPNDMRGAATADFDQDGDLDIAVVKHNGGLFLFRNDTVTTNHWLQLKLEGQQSNPDAIGAIVKIKAGPKKMMRQIKGGSSAHSQDSLVVHFGVPTETVESVRILWPSGTTDVLRNVNADTMYTIVEGSTLP